MTSILCCKCFTEFDDEEYEACPLCDFPVCHRDDCETCNRESAEKRYRMAEVMLDEKPFI